MRLTHTDTEVWSVTSYLCDCRVLCVTWRTTCGPEVCWRSRKWVTRLLWWLWWFPGSSVYPVWVSEPNPEQVEFEASTGSSHLFAPGLTGTVWQQRSVHGFHIPQMLVLFGRPVSIQQAPLPAAGSPQRELVPLSAVPPPGQKENDSRLNQSDIKLKYKTNKIHNIIKKVILYSAIQILLNILMS